VTGKKAKRTMETHTRKNAEAFDRNRLTSKIVENRAAFNEIVPP
jgi:hypothetical protein